jgi:hypothetical protein
MNPTTRLESPPKKYPKKVPPKKYPKIIFTILGNFVNVSRGSLKENPTFSDFAKEQTG